MRVLSAALVAAMLSSPAVANSLYGTYRGEVKTVWPMGEARDMVLADDFSYEDPTGAIWIAPKGWRIDGASIPPWAWSFVGGPFEGKYRYASVFHDYACDKKERPWESVHLAFYYGMLASGVGEFKAKLMYAAVYFGGPRWEMTRQSAPSQPLSPVFKAATRRLGPDSMEARVSRVTTYASDIIERTTYTASISDLRLDIPSDGEAVFVKVATPWQANIDSKLLEQLSASISVDTSLKQIEAVAEALRRKQ